MNQVGDIKLYYANWIEKAQEFSANNLANKTTYNKLLYVLNNDTDGILKHD